jgi:branched-chain amino acid transport system substrate-binding protein
MQFINFIRRLGVPPVQHLFFKPGDQDISTQLEAIKAANPDAILFHGQPDDVGRFAAQFRAAGISARFFGFDRLMEEGYRLSAGAAAEGTTITYFFDPNRTDTPWVEFVARFEKRFGMKPDIYAAYGYDGANLMMEAIDHGGPNRFRIRDYLANLDTWSGVTGPMRFDGRWDNIAPFSIASFLDGQWRFEPPPPRAASGPLSRN